MDQTIKSLAAVAMMAFMAANGVLFGVDIVIAVMAAVPEAAPGLSGSPDYPTALATGDN